MEGFVCDRCGAAIFPGERGTLRLYLQNANEEVGVMPAADEGQYGLADLCPKCFDAVRDIVLNRVVTSKTRDGAFIYTGQEF